MGWLFLIVVLLLIGGMYAIPIILMFSLVMAYCAVQTVTYIVGAVGMIPCFLGYFCYWWYHPNKPLYHPVFKESDSYNALGSVLSGIIAGVYTFIHITEGTMLRAFGISVGVGIVVAIIGFVALYFKHYDGPY